MQTRQFDIGKPSPDLIQRSSNFELLPVIPQLPIITSQPAKNIQQYTWISGLRRGRFVFQTAKPVDGVFKAIEGTELRWTFYVYDPDNVLSQNPYSGLSFKWKKDGADITSLNLLNAERGVKSVKISRESCTPDLTGAYICEVTNQYGTVETIPLNLRIFSPKKFPKLYTNLLKNGNAESDIDGWTIEPGIVSMRFGDLWQTENASSTSNLASWYRFGRPNWERIADPGKRDYFPINASSYAGEIFRFSSEVSPLYNILWPWISKAESPSVGEDWRQWPSIPEWMLTPEQKGDNLNDILPEANRWMLATYYPNLVSNEHPWDGFGSFFPSMKLIDNYNINSSSIGLQAESANKQLCYFTRDRIKFEKFGSQPTVTMRQTIDVSDLVDFVDGQVYGVAHLSYQFFAYVGIGITNYKIRITKPNGEPEELNWNIASSEQFYKHICSTTQDFGKVSIASGSDIEIVPLAEDLTEVTLNFRDQNGAIIKIERLKTPTALDIWALKEKAYFPLSLGPLFLFLKNAVTATARSNIKVFGQTITNTKALEGLFDTNSPFIDKTSSSETNSTNFTVIAYNSAYIVQSNESLLSRFSDYINLIPYQDPLRMQLISFRFFAQFAFRNRPQVEYLNYLRDAITIRNLPTLTRIVATDSEVETENTYGLFNQTLTKISDANARFLGTKIPFAAWDALWPVYWDMRDPPNDGSYPRRSKCLRSIKEKGAAAMIAVEANGTIPRLARSVEVVVNFKHKSDIFHDQNPEGKSWTEEELYADYMGYGEGVDDEDQASGNSARFIKYGNPRCGITKMKFLVVPNNFVPDGDYPSYKLPPAEFTVLGKSRQFIASDAMNTATAQHFVLQDDFTRPDAPPPIVGASNVFALNPDGVSYLSQQQYDTEFEDSQNEYDSFEQSVIDNELIDPLNSPHDEAERLNLDDHSEGAEQDR